MALSWKFSGTNAPATVKAGNCPYNFRVPSPTFARLFRGLALTRRFSGGSMTGTANSFGQEALDFVESLDRLDTSDAVLDTMQGAISRFGFEGVAFERVRQLLAVKRASRRSPRASAKCSPGRRKGSRPGRSERSSRWASER